MVLFNKACLNVCVCVCVCVLCVCVCVCVLPNCQLFLCHDVCHVQFELEIVCVPSSLLLWQEATTALALMIKCWLPIPTLLATVEITAPLIITAVWPTLSCKMDFTTPQG